MFKINKTIIHHSHLCFLCLICVKERAIESDLDMFFFLRNYYNTEIVLRDLLHLFIYLLIVVREF